MSAIHFNEIKSAQEYGGEWRKENEKWNVI